MKRDDLTLAVFDVETFSSADLPKVGAARYARDPSTDVLCVAWNDPTSCTPKKAHLWVPGDPPPKFLCFDAVAKGCLLAAFNVQFDMAIWREVLTPVYGWPWPGEDAFYDLQADASYFGLPRSLKDAAKALGTAEKNALGAKVCKTLCKPARAIQASSDPRRKHTPEALKTLYDYCKDDVVAETALATVLPRLPVAEQLVRSADLRMNERGILCDLPFVRAVLDLIDHHKDREHERLAAITNGEVTSSNQRNALVAWCASQGWPMTSLDKDHIRMALEDDALPEIVREVLLIRQDCAKASLAKFDKMVAAACPDSRLRGMMGYYGAHTGRWASYIVQLQNLPRGMLEDYDTPRPLVYARDYDTLCLLYGQDKIMDVLSSMVRAALIAPVGSTLLISDFSAIEGRVLAWLAGEEHVLQAYREGKRLYCMAAADIFGVPYDVIYQGRNKDPKYKRMDLIGKVCELALGFQGHLGAFASMGANYNVKLPDEEASTIIRNWRDGRPATTRFWRRMNDAMLAACRNRRQPYKVGRLIVRHSGQHLRIRLPSGRNLIYRDAHIHMKPLPWDIDKEAPAVHFYGVNSYTRQYCLQDTYGGAATENCLCKWTLVLTHTGVKHLWQVAKSDMVWDGEEWVFHAGFIDQGVQEVIEWLGVHLTGNHLILAGKKWLPATALEDRATQEALLSGRGSDLSVFSRLVSARTLAPFACVTADLCAEKLFVALQEDTQRDAVHAQSKQSRQRENEERSLACRGDCWTAGAIVIPVCYLVALILITKLSPTMAGAALAFTSLGFLTGFCFSSTLRRSTAMIKKVWTWTASTMTGTTNREICASQQEARTQETEGHIALAVDGSSIAENHCPFPSSTDASAQTGPCSLSASISTKGEAPKTSFKDTRAVGDLRNAGPRKRFTIITANGPVIVHNCVQAVARDLMSEALLRAEAAGFTPILTVHDEIVCEEPVGTDIKTLDRVMEELPAWATGLPISAKGFASPYYKK